MLPIIVLEGLNGAGKTTQINHLMTKITELGIPSEDVVTYRDPGGTEVGEAIRALVKDPNLPMSPKVQLQLYTAARSALAELVQQHQEKEGKLVILDRWVYSTLAYQGRAIGNTNDLILGLHKKLVGTITQPEFVIYLSIPVKLSAGRTAKARGQDFDIDRFEAEGEEGLLRVKERYDEMADIGWMTKIDVSSEETQENLDRVWDHLRPKLEQAIRYHREGA